MNSMDGSPVIMFLSRPLLFRVPRQTSALAPDILAAEVGYMFCLDE